MRFLKLELTWDASQWVHILSDGSKLAWIKLLCYAKASGLNGRVKRLTPSYAQKVWMIGEEDVYKMEVAAVADGALSVEDGCWIVTNWAKYQGDETAAERMKRYRETKNVTDVTRNATVVTEKRREEKRGEKKRRDISPPTPSGGTAQTKGKPSDLSEVTDYYWLVMPEAERIVECEKFFDHFESNGWKQGGKTPMRDWKAAFRNWMRNANNFGGAGR